MTAASRCGTTGRTSSTCVCRWVCGEKNILSLNNIFTLVPQVETAHQFGSEITGVQFAYDNRMLATRSNDETLKLWDVRWVNNLQ